MKVDTIVSWYRKEKWWPHVLHGLVQNREHINKVIISNDERWGEWRPKAFGSSLTIQLLERDHDGWGAGRVLNEAVKHVEAPHFLHIDGDIQLAADSLRVSSLYLDDVSLLACRIHNTTEDAHLEAHEDGLVLAASQVHPDQRDFAFRSPLPLNLRHGHFIAATDKWLPHDCETFKVDGADAYFSMDYVLAAKWMMAYGRDSFAFGGGAAYHLGGIYSTPPPEAECDENKRKVRQVLKTYAALYGEGEVEWNKEVELIGGNLEAPPPDYVEKQRSYNVHHTDGSVEGPHDADFIADVAMLIRKRSPIVGSILDIGCRTGVSLTALHREFPDARVAGVDIVPDFIHTAMNRGEAYVADAHHLPFKDGEFEWIVCKGTFEHFYNSQRAAGEMARVASKGVYVTCDLRKTPLTSDFAYTSNAAVWRAVFEKVGFKVAHEEFLPDGVEFMLVKQ